MKMMLGIDDSEVMGTVPLFGNIVKCGTDGLLAGTETVLLKEHIMKSGKFAS